MKLKPCPFCGAKTIDRMITHSNKCFIHKLIYMHPAGEVEEAWQIRATDPLLKEMAEALDGLLYRTDGITFQEKWDVGARVLQKYHEQEGE